MSQKGSIKKKWKYLKSIGSSLTLFAIFSFRNGFMMAKMPLNIRGSFTTWTAFIRMGKPSCGGREGGVRTCGASGNCPLPQPGNFILSPRSSYRTRKPLIQMHYPYT